MFDSEGKERKNLLYYGLWKKSFKRIFEIIIFKTNFVFINESYFSVDKIHGPYASDRVDLNYGPFRLRNGPAVN